MKRDGTDMPARNSYSCVRASTPRWISAAEAVVPPMSKATRLSSFVAAPSRSAPTAPDERPEEMKNTGFCCATLAEESPPLELPISSGAVTPWARSFCSSRVR